MAFTTLIDTPVVAIVALLPGNCLGAAAVLLACAGISSAIGVAVLSLRDWPERRHLADLLVIPVLGVLYIVQLVKGINLSLNPSHVSAVHLQALLVIVSFLIAIVREWQMIGARERADLLTRQPHLWLAPNVQGHPRDIQMRHDT